MKNNKRTPRFLLESWSLKCKGFCFFFLFNNLLNENVKGKLGNLSSCKFLLKLNPWGKKSK